MAEFKTKAQKKLERAEARNAKKAKVASSDTEVSVDEVLVNDVGAKENNTSVALPTSVDANAKPADTKDSTIPYTAAFHSLTMVDVLNKANASGKNVYPTTSRTASVGVYKRTVRNKTYLHVVLSNEKGFKFPDTHVTGKTEWVFSCSYAFDPKTQCVEIEGVIQVPYKVPIVDSVGQHFHLLQQQDPARYYLLNFVKELMYREKPVNGEVRIIPMFGLYNSQKEIIEALMNLPAAMSYTYSAGTDQLYDKQRIFMPMDENGTYLKVENYSVVKADGKEELFNVNHGQIVLDGDEKSVSILDADGNIVKTYERLKPVVENGTVVQSNTWDSLFLPSTVSDLPEGERENAIAKIKSLCNPVINGVETKLFDIVGFDEDSPMDAYIVIPEDQLQNMLLMHFQAYTKLVFTIVTSERHNSSQAAWVAQGQESIEKHGAVENQRDILISLMTALRVEKWLLEGLISPTLGAALESTYTRHVSVEQPLPAGFNPLFQYEALLTTREEDKKIVYKIDNLRPKAIVPYEVKFTDNALFIKGINTKFSVRIPQHNIAFSLLDFNGKKDVSPLVNRIIHGAHPSFATNEKALELLANAIITVLESVPALNLAGKLIWNENADRKFRVDLRTKRQTALTFASNEQIQTALANFGKITAA